jgi:uncharacterized membrane protein YqjE
MESGAPGLLGSLRGFADGFLGSVHHRLELLALELHEEKFRLIQILIWVSSIMFLAMLALIFLSFAIVVVLWDVARITAICALAGGYVVGLVAAVVGFRRYLQTQPKPFAATLGELKEDRACIRPEH